MLLPGLNLVTDLVIRRRVLVGSCSTCAAHVFEDERHVRMHGVLLHRRCVAYRRRA